ncbi:hypothetical protein [Demequina litorisediminis]
MNPFHNPFHRDDELFPEPPRPTSTGSGSAPA